MISSCWVLLVVLLLGFLPIFVESVGYQSILPPGCDSAAALQCEYEFLLCKLFHGKFFFLLLFIMLLLWINQYIHDLGPANDQATLCYCAGVFYGSCLRLAGVSSLSSLYLLAF